MEYLTLRLLKKPVLKNHTIWRAILILFILTCHPLMAFTGILAEDITESRIPLELESGRHGYSDFDSLPLLPRELPADSHRHSPLPESPIPEETPQGLFQEITLAKSFEEDLEHRRGHFFYPVEPTATFPIDSLAVFVVFKVFQHYSPYQIIGRVYRESDTPPSDHEWYDEDIVFLTPEDESGYLKLFPPKEGWTPGPHRVDIYVGFQASSLNHMGILRFTINEP
jgi:hypothetical protein